MLRWSRGRRFDFPSPSPFWLPSSYSAPSSLARSLWDLGGKERGGREDRAGIGGVLRGREEEPFAGTLLYPRCCPLCRTVLRQRGSSPLRARHWQRENSGAVTFSFSSVHGGIPSESSKGEKPWSGDTHQDMRNWPPGLSQPSFSPPLALCPALPCGGGRAREKGEGGQGGGVWGPTWRFAVSWFPRPRPARPFSTGALEGMPELRAEGTESESCCRLLPSLGLLTASPRGGEGDCQFAGARHNTPPPGGPPPHHWEPSCHSLEEGMMQSVLVTANGLCGAVAAMGNPTVQSKHSVVSSDTSLS